MKQTVVLESFKEEMRAKIKDIKEKYAHAPLIGVFTSDAKKSLSWLIWELSNAEIPFKVRDIGGGVKRLTTDLCECPRCGGTGRILKKIKGEENVDA